MLLSSFSLNMINKFPAKILVKEISAEEARLQLLALAEEDGESELIQSAVGHADTAAIFSDVLGLPVRVNRITVSLKTGDRAVVGQYSGPRLQEGAIKLPEGAAILWLALEVK